VIDYFLDRLKKAIENGWSFFTPVVKFAQYWVLKLIAENLGAIPPNTALLIITTRKNRYTITLSSDYLQNGSVELFLKE